VGRLSWPLLLLGNAPLAIYFGRWHQAGPISVMWHLAEEASSVRPIGHQMTRYLQLGTDETRACSRYTAELFVTVCHCLSLLTCGGHRCQAEAGLPPRVLFLMPCHSTPWHASVRARASPVPPTCAYLMSTSHA
jgi:hypothetical protein